MKKIILGIDPGIADTGFGIIKKHLPLIEEKRIGHLTLLRDPNLRGRLWVLWGRSGGAVGKWIAHATINSSSVRPNCGVSTTTGRHEKRL